MHPMVFFTFVRKLLLLCALCSVQKWLPCKIKVFPCCATQKSVLSNITTKLVDLFYFFKEIGFSIPVVAI